MIGANGAGKTSLLNAIMGVLPMSGDVAFDGRLLNMQPIEERVAGGLSLVPEKRELFASMSVEDNLRLGAYRLGGKAIRTGLADVFRRFPAPRGATRPEGRHALGRRAPDARDRARADGPAAAADARRAEPRPRPAIVKEIFHIVGELKETGVSILLVEQNARAALQIADWAYVMELGEIVMQGPAAELAGDKRVIESYLGLGRG